MMNAGRCRAGRREILANLLVVLALFAGTHALAIGSLDLNPSAWSAPWTGDVVLVSAGLLFLGLAVLLPLHAGLLNLAVHAQFLAGFAVGALVARSVAVDPGAQAALGLLCGALAGAFTGIVVAWLKQRFAIHEVLTGLLLSAAFAPLALAVAVDRVTPPALTIELSALTERLSWAGALKLPPSLVLAWGILLLVAFGHREPVVAGCRAVVLRVPSVTGGVSPFGPVRAVFAFRVQHFGEVGVVATLLGRCVAGIGDGVTLVGGG